MIGRRVGPYEILAQLGAGGMGEVWRARDRVLDREVAIKTLPAALARDAGRLARLEREAKLLASLSHPNVAAVHGLHEVDGELYLAMELVEGETLAARAERGAIPVEQALDWCRQIAEGLEAAHDRRVVHRDLKPANVMITPDGRVKVLDFGLARHVRAPVPDEDATTMLVSDARTREGVIRGTPAYMSPEQVRGDEADSRADVWAFGCVVYEVLAGRAAFPGDGPSDILAAVLRSEPDLSLLPADTPAPIARLVRRCLRKEPRRRLQSIADARVVIEDVQTEPAGGSPEAPPPGRHGFPRAWPAGVLLVIVAALAAYWSLRPAVGPRRDPVRPARFELAVPELYWAAGDNGVAVSPDGATVVYVSHVADRQAPVLWLRDLDDLEPRRLPGTGGAINPFWSPDGGLIGYVQQGAIKVVDRGGGPSRKVFEAGPTFGAPSLSAAGSLLVSPAPPGSRRIRLVPMQGGEPSFATPQVGEGYLAHTYPFWLPDGRRFLYLALAEDATRPSQLYLASLDGDDPQPVRGVHSRAEYASGRLFYWEDGAVVSRAFDPDAGALTGDPVQVCRTTGAHNARAAMAVFSTSSNGDVVVCGREDNRVELRWYDPAGRHLGDLGQADAYRRPRISPDGGRVAVTLEEPRTGARDIWGFELERGVGTRWIGGPGDETRPVWSPDGEHLAYSSDSAGAPRVLIRRADGRGEATAVPVVERLPSYPEDWSRDGTSLLYVAFDEAADLYRISLDDGEPQLFAGGAGHQFRGRFSPDGAWVLFVSTELGSLELFVAPASDGNARQRVSRAGAVAGVWDPAGERIYYATGDAVLSVPFAPASGTVGKEELLFSLGRSLEIRDLDVGPAGERFLVATRDGRRPRASVTVVLTGSMAANGE